MAGADNVQFNTLERALSGDMNDLESMAARELSDLLREMFGTRTFALAATPIDAPRSVVLGGLEVSPSGADIVVASGALAQEAPALAPVPGALDSSYRLAINRVPEVITGPVPGIETFFLLEAQMVNVVTSSEVRDVFDPALNLFVPTPVDKLLERQIDFQLVTGAAGNAPVPTGTPWVPIAIVRRPGGGGPVLASDLIDVRPVWDSTESSERDVFSADLTRQLDRKFVTIGVPGAAASELVVLEAEARVLGQRLWFFSSLSFDPTASIYIDPTTVLAADTWFYLYLVPWQGLLPVDPSVAGRTGKGLLVLSSVVPTAQGNVVNGAPLTLPPPYGVTPVAANGATVVAALRRNSANTGWVPSANANRGFFTLAPALNVGTFVPLVTPTALGLGPVTPNSAKMARVQVRVDGNGASGNLGQLLIAPTGNLVGYNVVQFDDGGADTFVFDIPLILGVSVDIRYIGVAAPDVIVEIIGWYE